MNVSFSKTNEMNSQLLWLDDEVEDFVGAREKLTNRGVQVLEAKTIDEALGAVEKTNVRVCLVDLKLNSGQEGVDFIVAAHAKHPQLCFLVYSHYAHLTEPHRRLTLLARELKGRLWNLPKDAVPSITSTVFDKFFTDPILSLINKQSPPTDLVAKFDELDKKYLSEVSLTKYLTLPLEERAEIVSDFRTRHANVINQLFREGNAWVLFLGEDEKPFRTVKDRRLIPNDDEIGEIAFQYRRVPFHFFSDVFADDFDSGRCSMESQARGYPTIRIEFKGSTFDTHFDTGLYESRFDYNFCNEVGLIGNINFPGAGLIPSKAPTSSTPIKILYSMTAFNVEASIFKSSTEESFDIKLRGIATLNWEKTLFSRACYSDCAYYDIMTHGNRMVRRKNGRTCLFRNGLLGRTLLEDNEDLKIILRRGNTDIDWTSGVLLR